jgi:microcystin-dependent protein
MPYLSELRIFSFSYAPRGWAMCNGQRLSISANAALYTLIGTTYGGDGTTYFNLPDFQGRAPTQWGYSLVIGQSGGEAGHALVTGEMPIHNHAAMASTATPDVNTALGNHWTANTGDLPYGTLTPTPMAPTALMTTGTGLPHENMSPYLVLNICIATAGIFPSPPLEGLELI